MQHERGTLYWDGCTKTQARNVVRNAGIKSELFTIALGRFLSEDWSHGPHIYLIDSESGKAARIDNQGCEEYAVKVSSRTATEVLDDLYEREISYGTPRKFWVLDNIIVLG